MMAEIHLDDLAEQVGLPSAEVPPLYFEFYLDACRFAQQHGIPILPGENPRRISLRQWELRHPRPLVVESGFEADLNTWLKNEPKQQETS